LVQNSEIFIGIAHIAGIFVGFEALISVTHQKEVGRIRGIVTVGLMTIVAALIPIGLGAYGVSGHSLWFLSSLIYLCLNWTVLILSLRMPENRELVKSQTKTSSILFWLIFEVPLEVPLILSVIGLFPHLEQAFYITALLFNLFSAAYVLSQIVYSKAD
jgi:ABC-type arginine/histidine transport system permease subunit